MNWWVYKCNSLNLSHQRHYGDWRTLFFDDDESPKADIQRWGTTEVVPALADLARGDMVIAYQTDRNTLVGIARVHQSCERDTCVYLKPVSIIGVEVRPLQTDARIAAIKAFKGGFPKTLYSIASSDVQTLLDAAGAATPAGA